MPTKKPQRGDDLTMPRAIGQFFGHLWQATRRPVEPKRPAPAQRTEVRRQAETGTAEIGGRKVVLRRTIIEEVELPPDADTPDAGG